MYIIQQKIYVLQINEFITTCIKIGKFQNNTEFKRKLEKDIYHLHKVSVQNNTKYLGIYSQQRCKDKGRVNSKI